MNIIAKRLAAIKPSPTMAVTAKVAELRALGKDIIGLGAGEPDFDTPDHIKQAAIKSINDGFTKYTPVSGTNELKDAIIAKLSRDNNLDYKRNEILVGCGAKQVIFNCFLATINVGDEVIIPTPYWVSYPDMVTVAEGMPIIVQCNNFKLTPEILENSISNKTKWLILNSPSNPSGVAYSADELSELGKILLKYPQINILSDDIYEYLIYNDFKFNTLATICPELQNRILVVNGVSKAYSMTGWRIGYGAGNATLIKAISNIQSHSTSNPCSISQKAAVAALNGNHEFLAKWLEAFKSRRDIVVKLINEINGLECSIPNGAFYVFTNCQKLLGDRFKTSAEFCDYLLEDALVAVVMGEAFGMEGYFRISYAVSESKLIEACKRIKQSVDKL